MHRAAVACAEPSHLRHQNSAQIGKPSDQRRWRPERWPARLVTGRVKALALWDRPTCVAGTSLDGEDPMKKGVLSIFAALATTALAATASVQAQVASTTFFVSSVGKGNGADLGGLEGADAHCAALARAAGSTQTNWRAYLSTAMPGGDAGINARDRIGKGPWQNAKGVVVGKSVEDLHSENANITKETALTEKAEMVSGRGDSVNMHDILTGSDPMGMFSTAGGDTSCGNWTKSGEGSAIVGHHDRTGLKPTRHMQSWNSSHGTRGCSQDQLKSTGGAGLIYCFVAN